MPSNIDHIHILSFDAKRGQMEFVSLHSHNLYIVSKTNGLDLIRNVVNQIIAKEILIKDQINNFLADIISQNISFTTTQKPAVMTDNPIVSNVDNVDKRSVTHLSSSFSGKSSKNARFRGDIWDLFSGYSLQSSIETVNENYRKTNRNFENIRLVEKALIQRQKTIVDTDNKQSAQLLLMHQSFIFSEMQFLSQKYFNNLIGRLQFSLEKIGNYPIFSMIMVLATKMSIA